jgi:hypothetical protein
MKTSETKGLLRNGVIVLLVVLVAVAAGTGCAGTPRVAKMTPLAAEVQLKKHLPYTVSVESEKGVEVTRNKHGFGNHLTQEMLVEAVVSAVEKDKLFSAVVPKEQADYNLYVTLLDVTCNLEDPVFGYSMTYTVTAKWKLVQANTGKIVFIRQIESTGRDWALNGITRNTVCREASAKQNIIDGFHEISELDLT